MPLIKHCGLRFFFFAILLLWFFIVVSFRSVIFVFLAFFVFRSFQRQQ